ncbi:aminotransferase class V-fold PLP-dependent enzyme [Allostreptomyces psammosilenae]|uniref:Selenocysteine lyase/cysteine desulfurase n=1 Tax=Allostreptomyces psammosilenae TaxID=1892865 RepID=A0A853ACU3_9ACTN|nr:aminotransferase class V-fold PLP-dependent enzyme [Allostreptomyces psammosilenae]NYI08172.1 selenocysteine lyase/cysteine desulfurase [Allostreptomyces psammosilenae]
MIRSTNATTPPASSSPGGLPGYAEHFSESEGYLNFASVGPPSDTVLRTQAEMMGRLADPGPGTVGDLMTAYERARAAAARLARARTDQVVLVPNTSTGLFHVAFGLPGGRVLLPSRQFPSNRYAWERAASLGRSRALPVPLDHRGWATPDTVRAALEGTRGPGAAPAAQLAGGRSTDAGPADSVVAVAVSAVDFRSGHRADLAALREVAGDRLLIVDAIQGFGVADMAWEAADVIVVGGQKWLRAGWGTGFMVVRDRALERLEPVLSGWTGAQDAYAFDDRTHEPLPDAGRFSLSNPSPVTAGGLASALELVESVGVPALDAYVTEVVGELLEVVRAAGGVPSSPVDPAERAGIVTFTLPGRDTAAVGRALEACGVVATVRPEHVRLSAHGSTTAGAVERVRAALAEVGAGAHGE